MSEPLVRSSRPQGEPPDVKRTSHLCSRRMWWCLIFASHLQTFFPPLSCSSYPPACLTRQSSSTRRSKIRPARLGASGDWTHDRLPRAAAWPETGALSTPRNSTGINEYLYSLSLRWPEAVRCSALGVVVSPPRCSFLPPALAAPCARRSLRSLLPALLLALLPACSDSSIARALVCLAPRARSAPRELGGHHP